MAVLDPAALSRGMRRRPMPWSFRGACANVSRWLARPEWRRVVASVRRRRRPPDLSDPAAGEADDEDLVVPDGFAGWWEVPVLALVGPGNRVPADDLVPLRDHVLDR